MQIDLLKQIMGDIAGLNAENLVNILYNKKNVNEFLIAKKLNLTINQTRNILYKLADEGLVSFIRKKDKKKGGWYTYFWTLNTGKSLTKFKNKIDHKIKQLEQHLNSRKTKRYFVCKNCDIEYSEENALLNEYTCQECGEILEAKDNEEIVEQIKKEITHLEKALTHLNEEIEIVNKKEQKIKERKLKAEKEKKDEERAKKRKARQIANALEKKKLEKNKPLKKTKKKLKKKIKKPRRKVKKKKKSKK